ncbi:MAG: DUF3520 domain-containing protein [Candidatus Competibacteraceae bacterium]|nr:DUF3520 domain-containing protein [Candidatus Competibacteraceae bacterium]
MVSEDCHIYNRASVNFRFASSIAMFGLLLRNSEYMENNDANLVLKYLKKRHYELK